MAIEGLKSFVVEVLVLNDPHWLVTHKKHSLTKPIGVAISTILSGVFLLSAAPVAGIIVASLGVTFGVAVLIRFIWAKQMVKQNDLLPTSQS